MTDELTGSPDDGRVQRALVVAAQYGQIQGDHHRAWVIDQIVRELTGEGYAAFVESYTADDEYVWDEGIAP